MAEAIKTINQAARTPPAMTLIRSGTSVQVSNINPRLVNRGRRAKRFDRPSAARIRPATLVANRARSAARTRAFHRSAMSLASRRAHRW